MDEDSNLDDNLVILGRLVDDLSDDLRANLTLKELASTLTDRLHTNVKLEVDKGLRTGYFEITSQTDSEINIPEIVKSFYQERGYKIGEEFNNGKLFDVLKDDELYSITCHGTKEFYYINITV